MADPRQSFFAEDYPVFPPLNAYFATRKKHNLLKIVEKVCSKLAVDFSKIDYEEGLLYDIVDMVERRRIYSFSFLIFYLSGR
jgi:hypothetical protein